MIPKTKIKEFLERPRDDFRPLKTLSDKALEKRKDRLPVKPPIWKKLHKRQKVGLLVGAKLKKFAFFYRCVAPDTLIETSEGSIRIDELAARGTPIKVYSVTNKGIELVEATCPFLIGKDYIYKVQLSCGRSIRVTGGHRFLTSRGWISCADLRIGEYLPVFSVSHLQSSSGFFPSMFQQDAESLSQTVSNFELSYSQDYHLGDALPHGVKDNVLNNFPSQLCVPERNHLYGRKGDQVFLSKCNRLDLLSARHSTYDSQVLSFHCSMYKVFCAFVNDNLLSFLILGNNLLKTSISFLLQLIFAIRQFYHAFFLACHPYPSLTYTQDYSGGYNYELFGRDNYKVDQSPQTLNLYQCVSEVPSWVSSFAPVSRVVKIAKVGFGDYYDLHVPKYENYIANGICNHNTGTGKTLLTIALARYHRRADGAKTCLVLVPNKINCHEWARELEQHCPKATYSILEGSSERKWELFQEQADFSIVTYAGMAHMVSDIVPTKRKNKNKLKPDKAKVRAFCSMVDGVICDESTSIASHRSLAYRVVRQLSKRVTFLYLLTGTPFGRDPTPLWAQMYVVDQGETLGPTLGIFREAFFSKSKSYWGRGFDYKFKKTMKKELNRLLAHRSLEWEAGKDEMPSLIPYVKVVKLPMESTAYYNKAKEQLRKARGNFKETKNAFLRMRQISSGFIGYYDDEVGERAKFVFDENPKLDMLLSVIDSIEEDKQLIVFHQFTFSGDQIAKSLKEKKIKFARIYGSEKDPKSQLDKFTKDPKCRVFLIQNDSGAYGLNLQMAQYFIYYEAPVRPIIREQTKARSFRTYSPHKTVFQIDLVVEGTYDQKILDSLAEGMDLFKAIVKGDYGLD